MRRRTCTCGRCGRTDVRLATGDVPHGWATALISTGPVAQTVVPICPRCPLPAGTRNPQPEHRHHA